MKTLLQRLATHPFLRGLKRQQLDLISQGAEELIFEPGDIIFREQEPASHFYLIEAGELALDSYVPHDGYAPIQRIGAGHVLGWSWLLAPFLWQFRAQAVKQTRVLRLDGAHALICCERDHELGYTLLKRVTQVVIERLQATRRRLVETGLAQPIPALDISPPALPPGPPLEIAIAEHPFLAGFPRPLERLLASYAMPAGFQADELVFKAGDPANRFYLIQQGRVALQARNGAGVLIQILTAGDALGWSWLYEPYTWMLDARTLTPAATIFFYATPLRELCESNHDLGYELMKRITHLVIQRLQAARRQLLALEAKGAIRERPFKA